MRRYAFVLGLSLLSACGGGGGGSPTPVPTPVPTPAPLTFTFTPQAGTAPPNFTMSIQQTTANVRADEIGLSIMAHGLSNICKVRGTVRWDGRVLRMPASEGWAHGPWFEQGGALVDWTFFTNSPGELVLFLDRPTSQGCVSGTGEIFRFYLIPTSGTRAGASQIQWDDPRLYDAGFRSQRLDNTFGGEVRFQ